MPKCQIHTRLCVWNAVKDKLLFLAAAVYIFDYSVSCSLQYSPKSNFKVWFYCYFYFESPSCNKKYLLR